MIVTVYEWGWWVRWDMILEMARRELCKPDASTVSICSLYTIEKRFSGNRESCPFWFRSREFAAKRELRSLFRPARSFFGGGGRQNSGFLLRFCLLQRSGAPGLEAAVDKIQAFRSFFVYFEHRAISSHQRTAFDKKSSRNNRLLYKQVPRTFVV